MLRELWPNASRNSDCVKDALKPVAEGMLATCATPPMFTSTSISKDFATFEYVGGGLGLSNPTREIIAEGHHAFDDEAAVACLLSIGCGHAGLNSLAGSGFWSDW